MARTWTRPERPTVVFDQALAWLRSGRVLLPGVSVLARCVSQVRAESATRLYSMVADGVDPELDQRLLGLSTVPVGVRVSELERLRKAPTRASGPEMVRTLDRVSEMWVLAWPASIPVRCPPADWDCWPGKGCRGMPRCWGGFPGCGRRRWSRWCRRCRWRRWITCWICSRC